jgi:hypothetical protein
VTHMPSSDARQEGHKRVRRQFRPPRTSLAENLRTHHIS